MSPVMENIGLRVGEAVIIDDVSLTLARGPLQIGIRPDFVTLAPTGGLPGQVRKVDDLGRKRLAHVTLGGQATVAMVPDEMQSIGTEACVLMAPERLLVYHNDVRVAGEAL